MKNIRDKFAQYLKKNFAEKVTLAIIIPLFYFAISAGQETYNPLNWKTVSQRRAKIEQKLDYQNSLRQEFKRLDLNNDAVIDSTEFIYRK